MVSEFFPINPPQQIMINHIFSDNHNWDVYRYKHRDELRDVEIEEVEKMLSCGEQGYRLFECSDCGEVMVVHFGCNSRVCTHCGKRFTDKWAESIARKTFDVKHRHVVMTIPEELRSVFYEDRTLLKVLMDCAITAISNVMEWKLNYRAVPGIVVVLHTYGKDMKFNPHLHCLVTEGGFKNNGIWVSLHYFPFRMVRTSWQYQLLTRLKVELENTIENSRFIDRLFKKYPEGFYVRAKDTINNKKGMVKYIGRYIRHPAVAESRIVSYDGKEVVFWYEDDEDIRHYVTMGVEEFIHAVIDHIPNRQFKTIRHYGVYGRRVKRKFKRLLGLVSITQTKLVKFIGLWAPRCPKCGKKMEFVWSGKGEPPPKLKFGERIGDWNHISASVCRQ
jgi:hypothetical protein